MYLHYYSLNCMGLFLRLTIVEIKYSCQVNPHE